MAEWFEKNDFWENMYTILFSEDKFLSAPEDVEKLFDLVKFNGETILDLCCGPGRHAVAMAEKGKHVTGVDLSSYLVEKAETYSSEKMIDVEWIREDMRKFSRPEAFDLIVNLFTSFGYFEKEEEDLEVLQLIHSNLKAGGMLVMDMMSKEIFARKYQPVLCHRLPDGVIWVEEPRVVDNWSKIENEWMVIRDGEVFNHSFSLRVYSGREMRWLLEKADFHDIQLYGNLEGAPYDPEATRMIVTARK